MIISLGELIWYLIFGSKTLKVIRKINSRSIASKGLIDFEQ